MVFKFACKAITMIDFETMIYLFLFIIPAYIANSSPVILGGLYPIDSGKLFFDKKRIFGDGKTWFGLIGGFFCGVLSSILLYELLSSSSFDLFASKPHYYLAVGILLSAGTLMGDLFGSFLKRRFGARWGESTFLDQLTFLAGALLFCYPLGFTIIYQPLNVLFLVIFTYFIHRFANTFAHYIGIKKVPW